MGSNLNQLLKESQIILIGFEEDIKKEIIKKSSSKKINDLIKQTKLALAQKNILKAITFFEQINKEITSNKLKNNQNFKEYFSAIEEIIKELTVILNMSSLDAIIKKHKEVIIRILGLIKIQIINIKGLIIAEENIEDKPTLERIENILTKLGAFIILINPEVYIGQENEKQIVQIINTLSREIPILSHELETGYYCGSKYQNSKKMKGYKDLIINNWNDLIGKVENDFRTAFQQTNPQVLVIIKREGGIKSIEIKNFN